MSFLTEKVGRVTSLWKADTGVARNAEAPGRRKGQLSASNETSSKKGAGGFKPQNFCLEAYEFASV